jgi:hypothetical protein
VFAPEGHSPTNNFTLRGGMAGPIHAMQANAMPNRLIQSYAKAETNQLIH